MSPPAGRLVSSMWSCATAKAERCSANMLSSLFDEKTNSKSLKAAREAAIFVTISLQMTRAIVGIAFFELREYLSESYKAKRSGH